MNPWLEKNPFCYIRNPQIRPLWLKIFFCLFEVWLFESYLEYFLIGNTISHININWNVTINKEYIQKSELDECPYSRDNEFLIILSNMASCDTIIFEPTCRYHSFVTIWCLSILRVSCRWWEVIASGKFSLVSSEQNCSYIFCNPIVSVPHSWATHVNYHGN